MNRKEFLSKSAGAFAALSVTGMLRAQEESGQVTREYRHEVERTVDGESVVDVYTFRIHDSAVFSGTLDRVELEISSGETDGSYAAQKVGVYSAAVKKVKLQEKGRRALLKCGSFEWSKGQDLLSDEPFGELRKKCWIEVNLVESENSENNSIRVMNKKKSQLAEIKEYVPEESESDDYEGCFLLTASADHKGIPRNSRALKAMYLFHDRFVSQTEEGREMGRAYYSLAPRIVAKIRRHPRRDEILDSMHHNLYQPFSGLLRENRNEEALAYFAAYTLALKDALGLD